MSTTEESIESLQGQVEAAIATAEGHGADSEEGKKAYAEAVGAQGNIVRLIKGGAEGDIQAAISKLLELKKLAGMDVVSGNKKGKKGKGKGGKKKKEGGGNTQADAARAAKEAKKEAKRQAILANQGKKQKKVLDDEPYENTTPKGEFKHLPEEMQKTYNPLAVEAAWYDWWKGQGFFKPEVNAKSSNAQELDEAEKFVIPIPPPNVTGALHLGHALTNAIQDALVRWHRMQGHVTLWNPGTDHAGIATQTVVEKKLWRTEQKTRHDLGREAFVDQVWKWKDEYHEKITTQLQSLGGSYDWDREVFTMDERLSTAVKEAFVRMFDEGLIYRSTRLVNWCCKLNTAISDIEVDYLTLDQPKTRKVYKHDGEYVFGEITDFKYKVAGTKDEYLQVSTTRPETILGDTGVAVHPEDPRYTSLHGKYVIHPFSNKEIPIVLDSELVDMEFGTGAVKVTPAHDPNDYECGKRHNLEMINVMNDDGSMNANALEFEGMMRFEARKAVIEALKEKGLYISTKPHEMRLGICSRSKDVIEPILKPQWFVDCTTMAKRAADAVREGDLELVPKSHESTWFNYLDNIRPWCVSRQLWWGHRVPAYWVSIRGQDDALDQFGDVKPEYWIAARSEEEAREKACAKFGCSDEDILEVGQDPDVLDTWFSSGLFPFSMLGWPEETEDVAKYFPNQLLETGHDILFFWVARMVMMSLQLTDKLPFKQVYLHPMVRDAQGRKMSKSLGNVIDPLDVISGIELEQLHQKLYNGNLAESEILKAIEGQRENFPDGIERCGTDALRFSLCAFVSQTHDINLDIKRVESYRHFCNKVWNGQKLILQLLGKDFTPADNELSSAGPADMAEAWILSKLNSAVTAYDQAMTGYLFDQATSSIHSFFQYDLCDNFLEMAKDMVRNEGATEEAIASVRNTLYTCMDTSLRLLHPFMPFLTEELWQHLPRRPGDETRSIMLADFPKGHDEWSNAQLETDFVMLQDIMKGIRSVRAQYKLANKQKTVAFLRPASADQVDLFRDGSAAIASTTFSSEINVLTDGEEPPKGCALSIIPNCEIFLYIKDLVDVDKEIAKLNKNLAAVQKRHDALEAKTQVPAYQENVKENVKAKDQEKLSVMQEEIRALQENIAQFEEIKSA